MSLGMKSWIIIDNKLLDSEFISQFIAQEIQ